MDRIEKFKVNSSRWMSLENFKGEQWKPIVGIDNYSVSNLGRVRFEGCTKTWFVRGKHTHTYKPHIRKVGDNGNGYVNVTINGKRYYIHRLVSTAFIPNPLNKPEIDHINTNKKDNRVTNLRWVTKSENRRNAITYVEQQIAQSEPVVILDCWGKYIGDFYGIQRAADYLGVARSVLNDAMSKKRSAKTASGYIVVRKTDYDKDKTYRIQYKRGTSPYIHIPSDRMVLVIKDKKVLKVFPNTSFASFYYHSSPSAISRECIFYIRPRKYKHKDNTIKDTICYYKDATDEMKEQALLLFKEQRRQNP